MFISNNSISQIANDKTDFSLLITSSLLSTIGCIITIATYFLISDIKTMSRHIIVCISFADLITCLSNLSGIFTPKNITSKFCILQSFFGSTAILASFLWTTMLTFYLYMVIVKERLDYAKRMIIPWSHLLCWTIPLIINVVAVSTKNLGNDGDLDTAGWCWIKVNNGIDLFILV